MINDIVLTKTNWEPLCEDGFYGVFDGGGYTISDLYYYQYDDEEDGADLQAGLFAKNAGKICNVNLKGVSLTARASGELSDSYVGAIAASSANGTFENCHVLSGSCSAGTYFYKNWGGSYLKGGEAYAGGICGEGKGAFINCSNAASVSSSGYAAGIGYEGTLFSACVNTGNISAIRQSKDNNYSFNACGIAVIGGNVKDCINTGVIKAENLSDNRSVNASGITSSGTVCRCRNEGLVTAKSEWAKTETPASAPNVYAAGIGGSIIDQCINTGAVTAKTGYAAAYGGGIASVATEITDCVNTGEVTVNNSYYYKLENKFYRGGIAGIAETVKTSYNAAPGFWSSPESTASSASGGTVGEATVVTDCYFLTEYAILYPDGRSDSQLRTADGYDGFDFVSSWGFDPFSDYGYALPLWAIDKVTEITLNESEEIVLETVEGVWPDLSGYTVTLKNAAGKEVTRALEYYMLPDIDINEIGIQESLIWSPDVYGRESIIINVKEKSPVSIKVTKTPANAFFQYNSVFTTEYGTLAVEYDNGTSEEIDTANLEAVGYDLQVAGRQTVTITYKGKSTTYPIWVYEYKGFAIKSMPYKTTYIQGQEIDLSGLAIEGTYKNDYSYSYKTIDLSDIDISYNTEKTGVVEVKVSYRGESTSFNINILPAKVQNVTFTQPTQLSYMQGEELNLADGKVEVVYAPLDSTSTLTYKKEFPLTEDMISGYDKYYVEYDEVTKTYKASLQTVFMEYEGIKEEFLVYIKPFVVSAGSVKKSDAIRVSALINTSVDGESYTFMLAAYRDGKMVECKTLLHSQENEYNVELTQAAVGDELKLFILSDDVVPYLRPMWVSVDEE